METLVRGSCSSFPSLTNHKKLEYLRSAKRLNRQHARWSLFFFSSVSLIVLVHIIQKLMLCQEFTSVTLKERVNFDSTTPDFTCSSVFLTSLFVPSVCEVPSPCRAYLSSVLDLWFSTLCFYCTTVVLDHPFGIKALNSRLVCERLVLSVTFTTSRAQWSKIHFTNDLNWIKFNTSDTNGLKMPGSLRIRKFLIGFKELRKNYVI